MVTKIEQGHVRMEVCSMGENINSRRVFFVLETDTQKCPNAHVAFRRIMYDYDPGKANGSVTNLGMQMSYSNRTVRDATEYEEVKELGEDGLMHTVYDDAGNPQKKQRGWGQPMGYQGIFAVCRVEAGTLATSDYKFIIEKGIADAAPFISAGAYPTLRSLSSNEQKIAYIQACAECMADDMGVIIPEDDSIFHLDNLDFAWDNYVGSFMEAAEYMPGAKEKYFTADRVNTYCDVPDGFTLLHALKNFQDPIISANKEIEPHYYGNEARSKGDYFPCQNIVTGMFVDTGLAEKVDPIEARCTRWNVCGKSEIYTPESRTPALDDLREYLNGIA